MSEKRNPFNARMKHYEKSTRRTLPIQGYPYVVRLDGKTFSTWTRGFVKPYDPLLLTVFQNVTEKLVREFQMLIGYTQSDEITLISRWGEHSFGGRIDKIVSVMASKATSFFMAELLRVLLEKREMGDLDDEWLEEKIMQAPCFDGRVFQAVCPVPEDKDPFSHINPTNSYWGTRKMEDWIPVDDVDFREYFVWETLNSLVWRRVDCTKNAVNLVGFEFFSHKQLKGLKGPQIVEKVYQQNGVDFEKDYPEEFRYGTLFRRSSGSSAVEREAYKFTANDLFYFLLSNGEADSLGGK